MSILVLTTEPLPLPGQVTTGAGLRAWGLAAGLASSGVARGGVVVATPNTAGDLPPLPNLSDPTDPPNPARSDIEAYPGGPRLTVAVFERGALTEFVRGLNPDMVVMQHWGLMKELDLCACPLAIDLAGPHLLERLYWRSPDPNRDLLEKIEALGRADFVVCSGVWQRHYFLPYLQMAGWDVTAPDLAPVVPFSFSPRLPEPKPDRRLDEIVYGGVFLPWQDSEIALRAAVEALDESGRGRLHLYGGPHPQGDVSGGRFDQLWRDLGGKKPAGSGRVVTHGLAPFDQLLREYTQYGVALDLMARNPERELAYTTRTVVYMACGLPVIYNDYSELSQKIKDNGAGWVVGARDLKDGKDFKGLKDLIRSILDDPSEVLARGANAREFVARELNWEKTIGPLAAFCAAPKPRLGKEGARLQWESQPRRIAELERERDALESELATLRGKWFFKLYERRARWSWLAVPVVVPLMALAALAVWTGMMLTRAKGAGTSANHE